jgi:hypothetical protein
MEKNARLRQRHQPVTTGRGCESSRSLHQELLGTRYPFCPGLFQHCASNRAPAVVARRHACFSRGSSPQDNRCRDPRRVRSVGVDQRRHARNNLRLSVATGSHATVSGRTLPRGLAYLRILGSLFIVRSNAGLDPGYRSAKGDRALKSLHCTACNVRLS